MQTVVLFMWAMHILASAVPQNAVELMWFQSCQELNKDAVLHTEVRWASGDLTPNIQVPLRYGRCILILEGEEDEREINRSGKLGPPASRKLEPSRGGSVPGSEKPRGRAI